MKNTKYILLIIYTFVLALLGFRPKINALYNGLLPASDIGGWCMYQRYVSNVGTLTIQYGKSIKELEWKKYINHGGFANSAHPKVSKEVLKSFLDFLAQNHPKVTEIKKRTNQIDSLTLKFELIKIVEEKDSLKIKVSKRL